MGAYSKLYNSWIGWSRLCDCRILKAQVPLVQACHMVHRELVNPCSYWMASRRWENVTWITSTTMGKQFSKSISVKIEKSSAIKTELETHWNQRCVTASDGFYDTVILWYFCDIFCDIFLWRSNNPPTHRLVVQEF